MPRQIGPAGIVEAPDHGGITLEGGWRGDLVDTTTLPQSAGTAKGGHAAFCRDAGTGEDGNALGRADQIGCEIQDGLLVVVVLG